jgi:ABC-type Fe3+-hydroxamate transport system substrate-binding protein
VDSAGRRVTIPQPLKRIAGLQSSGCREFSLLQVEDRVVGVTEYMQGDPGMLPRLVGKPDIGSVYTPNYEIIAQVNPQFHFLFSYYGVVSGGQTALGALYLAKRLYPDRFSDVEPETFHKDYFEKWFDVEYKRVCHSSKAMRRPHAGHRRLLLSEVAAS